MKKRKFEKTKEPKTVAFIVWLFPKLSETFILNQLVQLKKLEYKTLIFAVKDPRRELAKEDLDPEKIIHEDVETYQLLNLTKYGSPKQISSSLKEEITKSGIDIVYFQFPDLAAEVLKYGEIPCPTITLFHDIPKALNKEEAERLQKKYKDVFENITIILAISEFTKNELIKLGCRKHKILVQPMGVDIKVFKPLKNEICSDPFNFVMIGRFVEKKGFIYGIRAFKKFLQSSQSCKNRKVQLFIVGDGFLRNTLQNEVKYQKLENYIHFFGKLPQKKLLNVLRTSHCLLCPSITTSEGKREGLPVVIMEAIACGIPVIATKHAAIPEIIKKDWGILVKEKSANELSKAMSWMVRSYKICKERAVSEGLSLVKEKYNAELLAKKLITLFHQAGDFKKEEIVFIFFSSFIERNLSSEIFSILVVGSIPRGETLSKQGDVDLVVVFENKNFISSTALLKLNKAIDLLEVHSGLKVTPQIFTRFDLFQLLSPVLIRNYIEDGKVVYGENISKLFRKRMSSISDFEYDIAILKRNLFERYFFRQYVSMYYSQKSDYSFCYRIAKSVLFLARDLLYLEKGIFITKREEIAKNFYHQYKDNTPSLAFKILIKEEEEDFKEHRTFIPHAIDFVETTCAKIIENIKRKYPNKDIYVCPF